MGPECNNWIETPTDSVQSCVNNLQDRSDSSHKLVADWISVGLNGAPALQKAQDYRRQYELQNLPQNKIAVNSPNVAWDLFAGGITKQGQSSRGNTEWNRSDNGKNLLWNRLEDQMKGVYKPRS